MYFISSVVVNFYQVTGARMLAWFDKSPVIFSIVVPIGLIAVLWLVPELLDPLIPWSITYVLLWFFIAPYLFAGVVIYWRRFLGL